MTHEELLARIDDYYAKIYNKLQEIGMQPMLLLYAQKQHKALRAVVELHNEGEGEPYCWICDTKYPCRTIRAIEEQLK